ncbi:MAG: GNAT family N-acetyltransferase [Ardenticatenaceae bacterium]|nr:GNAT family N-acetyltransferase [Ardenticatenaceae bacterium]
MLTETKTQLDVLDEFIMRPATIDDLETAVDLFNTCSQAQIGADEFTVEEYRTEWEAPGFDMENSTRAVCTLDGQLVGLVEVWDLANPPVKIWVWGRVHPDFEGLGIGTMLMEWAEERARQAIDRVPEGVQVIMQSGVVSTYEPPQHLFARLGMEQNRHFWRMAIDLAGNIPQAVWPDGITMRTFTDINDLPTVYRAVDEAFRDHWGYVASEEKEILERWRHFIETDDSFDPDLWFLAMDGDEIAGISLCRFKITDDPEMGFVDTLGVRRPWRRQGLGLAMLHHTFAEFKNRGQKRVGLGVDAASLTGATRLYEKAGMHVARQFANYAKVLRPGNDISTQTVTN